MNIVTPMMADERLIEQLIFPGPNYDIIEVGERTGYTRIVAYGEPGEHCYVPWFAIYRGDEVAQRVNGNMVETVIYAGIK